jgi:hypothetical protein
MSGAVERNLYPCCYAARTSGYQVTLLPHIVQIYAHGEGRNDKGKFQVTSHGILT